jgi:outer membrane protein assembly factor BamE (lipoprotein component of BamABCDE complex)
MTSSSPPVRQRSARMTGLFIVMALALASCATQVSNHGDHLDADRLSKIRPGVSSRDQVAQLLGSPSSTSMFDGERWYYISDVEEKLAVFDREITDRQVVTITFNTQGVVREVDSFGLERGREVEVVERTTPSFGESVSFLDQMLGNLGRFNREQPRR